ncbi:hypothetical protein K0M31_000832 [Melipona bicolor]|uniref:Uncharacterized protein n=1 Tax=Melipona bicolor TaxID=60889 RepID=A0AA40GEL5_9HYME|nr:hypothetical protein K0M31_000832 [Melipona bicolor]
MENCKGEKPQGKREIFAEGIGAERKGRATMGSPTIRKHGSVGNLSKLETCAGAVTNKGRDIHKLTLDLGAHGGSGGKREERRSKDGVHPAEVEGRQLVTPTLVRRAELALYLGRCRTEGNIREITQREYHDHRHDRINTTGKERDEEQIFGATVEKPISSSTFEVLLALAGKPIRMQNFIHVSVTYGLTLQ